MAPQHRRPRRGAGQRRFPPADCARYQGIRGGIFPVARATPPQRRHGRILGFLWVKPTRSGTGFRYRQTKKKGGFFTEEQVFTDPETGEVFTVGDVVELVSDDGEFTNGMYVGMTGIVMNFSNDWTGKPWIGVAWDIPAPASMSSGLHNLSGCIDEDRGYYVYPHQISYIGVDDSVEYPDEADFASFLEGNV